ncbi:hypothetical protein THAOC_04864 [Thalassiosira oceanica]|uniref:Uncharacterized protein n=1 Tax=Thalassiosira oceanica TaxID=159749 RepID=K0T462_THAOC|nr:hypothetical protein THAOC_04864 [Thalassiosira oceanica]|eukprot:EJK73508.1 hypothetical protein THAOC_04864 [Thalassiosira oceanica]
MGENVPNENGAGVKLSMTEPSSVTCPTLPMSHGLLPRPRQSDSSQRRNRLRCTLGRTNVLAVSELRATASPSLLIDDLWGLQAVAWEIKRKHLDKCLPSLPWTGYPLPPNIACGSAGKLSVCIVERKSLHARASRDCARAGQLKQVPRQ